MMTPREEAAAKTGKHSAGSAPVSLLAGVVEMHRAVTDMRDAAMIKAIQGDAITQAKVMALSNASWHLSMAKLYLNEHAS